MLEYFFYWNCAYVSHARLIDTKPYRGVFFVLSWVQTPPLKERNVINEIIMI